MRASMRALSVAALVLAAALAPAGTQAASAVNQAKFKQSYVDRLVNDEGWLDSYPTWRWSFSTKIVGDFSGLDADATLALALGDFDSQDDFETIQDLIDLQADDRKAAKVKLGAGKGSAKYFYTGYDYNDHLVKSGFVSFSWDASGMTVKATANVNTFKTDYPYLPLGDSEDWWGQTAPIAGNAECLVLIGERTFLADVAYAGAGQLRTVTKKVDGEPEEFELYKNGLSGTGTFAEVPIEEANPD